MRKIPWKEILLWLPTLFLVNIFARQGLAKFSATSGWTRAFEAWHYPVWFRIVIGLCEVLAAVFLLTRRTAPMGAALIAIVMLGGMGTHIYWGQPRQVTSEVVPLTLALIVLWGRWSHFVRMVSRKRERA